jgi:probable rRNA maturation factor
MTSPSSEFRIEITHRHAAPLIGDDDLLRQAAAAVLTAQNVRSAQISLVLTDDAEIRQINREFLGHDYPTDVISFLLTEASPATKTIDGEAQIDGELIISTETAQRVAAEQGCDAASEVVLYVVHGLLHLCGYDDQTESDRFLMRQHEHEILTRLNLHLGDRAPLLARGIDGSA